MQTVQMIVNKNLISLAAALSTALAVFSGDLQLKKQTGEYLVEIRLDRQPPVVGDNKIEVEIRDAGGAPVSDAQVLVNCYMPPMPRMAPMNYKIKTDFKANKYKAKMKFIMAGPWILAIKIAHKGKNLTAKFNIDVP
jgi:hypothetical protein